MTFCPGLPGGWCAQPGCYGRGCCHFPGNGPALATFPSSAGILMSKHVDHTPLYRQCDIYVRHGREVSHNMLVRWVLAVAEKLSPLAAALNRYILSAGSPDVLKTVCQSEFPASLHSKRVCAKRCVGQQWTGSTSRQSLRAAGGVIFPWGGMSITTLHHHSWNRLSSLSFFAATPNWPNW